MEKVKIFTSAGANAPGESAMDLEKNYNEWFVEHGKKIKVLDRHITTRDGFISAIVIFYHDL